MQMRLIEQQISINLLQLVEALIKEYNYYDGIRKNILPLNTNLSYQKSYFFYRISQTAFFFLATNSAKFYSF